MLVQLRFMAHYRTVRVSFIMVIGVVLCHIIIGSGLQRHIIITAVQINCWPIAGINYIFRTSRSSAFQACPAWLYAFLNSCECLWVLCGLMSCLTNQSVSGYGAEKQLLLVGSLFIPRTLLWS